MKNNSIVFYMTQISIGLSSLYGFMYLLGFWLQFSINPMRYIEFSDLFRASISPLFMCLFISLCILVYFKGKSEVLSGQIESLKGDELSIFLEKYLHKNKLKKYFYGSIILFMYFMLFGFVLSLVMTIFFILTNLIRKKFNLNTKIALTIILLLILFPAVSFKLGRDDATEIKYNLSYDYINENKDKLIGYLGEYMFSTDLKNECLYVDKISEISSLKISKYRSYSFSSSMLSIFNGVGEINNFLNLNFDEKDKNCDY